MGDKTTIEWTNSTWNPWQGCTKVSPGCDNCYAETLSRRWGRDFSTLRRSSDSTFYAPLRWEKKAAAEGSQRLVFTCSLSDFFHQQADLWREEAWGMMRRTPHLTYQLLTKRPGLAVDWYEKHGWLPNVWLGTSVESQRYAPRLDVLARVPAPVLFVSAEPLLGPLDLRGWFPGWCQSGSTYETPRGTERWDIDGSPVNPLNWVICGGESGGPGAHPMHPEFPRNLRDQCQAAGVPFFFKQWGQHYPCAEMLKGAWEFISGPALVPWGEIIKPLGPFRQNRILSIHGTELQFQSHPSSYPEGAVFFSSVGKNAAGALLDGREWREMPK